MILPLHFFSLANLYDFSIGILMAKFDNKLVLEIMNICFNLRSVQTKREMQKDQN